MGGLSPPNFLKELAGLRAKKKSVRPLSENIISLLRASSERCGERLAEASLEKGTGSSLEAQRPKNTCSKMLPRLRDLDLSLEASRSDATQATTGTKSRILPKEETSNRYPRMFTFGITARLRKSLQHLRSLLLWNEKCLCSGVSQVLVRAEGLGKKPVWTLILRIPAPSGGVATEVKKLLLSMNSEEISGSPIFYDGWTVIQSWWRLREGVVRY